MTDQGEAVARHQGVGAAVVLVVEDDDGNRLLVRRVLEEDGHLVLESSDGQGALRLLSGPAVDLVVLDLGLPGLDGLEVLAEIRGVSEVPVLLLTARREEAERVRGLDAGADDYMVKPYSVMELSARVRALLRRSQEARPVDRVDCGPVTVDCGANRAEVDGRDAALTPKEYALLEFLVLQSPRTFSREALLHRVWGSTSAWQDAATVTEHVRRIRAKLAAVGCPSDFITTVRGFGYVVARNGSPT